MSQLNQEFMDVVACEQRKNQVSVEERLEDSGRSRWGRGREAKAKERKHIEPTQKPGGFR